MDAEKIENLTDTVESKVLQSDPPAGEPLAETAAEEPVQPVPEVNLIEEIIKIAPVENHNFLVSRIFKIFKKLYENGNDEQIVEEVAEEIERRIENLEISIAESEAEGCPEEMEEVHNRIIESLELYCEGLSYFIEYIEDPRDEFILNAFKLIFQGDIITKELKQNIMEELKDRPRSSVA